LLGGVFCPSSASVLVLQLLTPQMRSLARDAHELYQELSCLSWVSGGLVSGVGGWRGPQQRCDGAQRLVSMARGTLTRLQTARKLEAPGSPLPFCRLSSGRVPAWGCSGSPALVQEEGPALGPSGTCSPTSSLTVPITGVSWGKPAVAFHDPSFWGTSVSRHSFSPLRHEQGWLLALKTGMHFVYKPL